MSALWVSVVRGQNLLVSDQQKSESFLPVLVMKCFLKHYGAQISFKIRNRRFEPLNAQEKDLTTV